MSNRHLKLNMSNTWLQYFPKSVPCADCPIPIKSISIPLEVQIANLGIILDSFFSPIPEMIHLVSPVGSLLTEDHSSYFLCHHNNPSQLSLACIAGIVS